MGERMKVLIGYDGSECADAALADLARAGLPDDVEALVLSVGDVFFPPPPPSSYEIVEQAFASRRVASAVAQSQANASRLLAEARALADRGCELLRPAFPGWELRAEAAAGNPGAAVIERAEGWPADLVVVGSQGRSALGRLFLGSVSKKVATETHVPVRVARCREGQAGAEAPVRIIVGFDGSGPARAAVRAVARRRWPAGSMARVVAVDDHPRPTSIAGLVTGAAPAVSESARSNLDRLKAGIGVAEEDLGAVAGLHVSCEIIQGEAKRVLIEEAEKTRADCIFVGSRGLSGRIERLLLGSVSAALVNDAPCSVEVVRGETG